MIYDQIFVAGLAILVLTIPAVVSAYSEGRTPRIAAIMLMIGGACLSYALIQKPGGYTFEDVPDAIFGVIGRILN